MDWFRIDYLERLERLIDDFTAAIDGLPVEALDWVPGPDMNSLCVLVVHTAGSARYWIGDVALGEPSGRDRDGEFRARGLDAEALKTHFAALKAYVRDALARLPDLDLADVGTRAYHGKPISAGWALLHALEHTGLHLGHAQITRQRWDQRAGQ